MNKFWLGLGIGIVVGVVALYVATNYFGLSIDLGQSRAFDEHKGKGYNRSLFR